MRTTLDIDDELLLRAKEQAVRQRSTLTRMIEEGLALRLLMHDLGKSTDEFQQLLRQGAARKPAGPRRPPNRHRLPVFAGQGGLKPEAGDGRTNRALFDAADGA